MNKFGTTETARRAREAKESQRLQKMDEAVGMARSGRSWTEIAAALGYRDVKALRRAVRKFCEATRQSVPRVAMERPVRNEVLSLLDEIQSQLDEIRKRYDG